MPAVFAGAPARPCPICGKPAIEKMRPFCSKRCADVDLHRWLGGVYAIPAGEADEDSKTDAHPMTTRLNWPPPWPHARR